MKVLQVLPELNAGGVERTTLEIAEALSREGFIPHICSNGGRMEAEFTTFKTRMHIVDIGSKNPLKMRAHTRRLIEIIKSENIDIVHARSRAPAWPAHAAARATGRPFLTTYHGIYNAGFGLKRRYNAIMAQGDLIIANSNFTKDHIIAEHGTDPNKIRVIPRGVDMEIFDPEKISQDNVKRQKQSWDIQDTGQKILLLPARLTRWKGQLVALEALANLPREWILIMMGDAQGRDAYVEEIKRRAKALGVTERIRLPGHSKDVAVAMKTADIVLVPSIEAEAFGRTAAEAQAMGTPVIASAHGGPLETVLGGKTGILVPPSDADAIAKAVEVITDVGINALKFGPPHIARNFSKKQLQSKTLTVYKELLM